MNISVNVRLTQILCFLSHLFFRTVYPVKAVLPE